MLYWLTACRMAATSSTCSATSPSAGGAFMTALVFGFIFGPPLINVLRKRQGKGQPIRDRRARGPFRQVRHAHHGRAADRGRAGDLHAASGRGSTTPCLDGAFRDAGLRADRVCRRLCQGVQAERQGRAGQGAASAGLRHRRGRGLWAMHAHHPAALQIISWPFRFSRTRCSNGAVLHPLRHVRGRRRGQRGEPDRRARRAGDHAGDDRGSARWASSPMPWGGSISPSTWRCITSPARARS